MIHELSVLLKVLMENLLLGKGQLTRRLAYAKIEPFCGT